MVSRLADAHRIAHESIRQLVRQSKTLQQREITKLLLRYATVDVRLHDEEAGRVPAHLSGQQPSRKCQHGPPRPSATAPVQWPATQSGAGLGAGGGQRVQSEVRRTQDVGLRVGHDCRQLVAGGGRAPEGPADRCPGRRRGAPSQQRRRRSRGYPVRCRPLAPAATVSGAEGTARRSSMVSQTTRADADSGVQGILMLDSQPARRCRCAARRPPAPRPAGLSLPGLDLHRCKPELLTGSPIAMWLRSGRGPRADGPLWVQTRGATARAEWVDGGGLRPAATPWRPGSETPTNGSELRKQS
jgi:hypothetical protein